MNFEKSLYVYRNEVRVRRMRDKIERNFHADKIQARARARDA